MVLLVKATRMGAVRDDGGRAPLAPSDSVDAALACTSKIPVTAAAKPAPMDPKRAFTNSIAAVIRPARLRIQRRREDASWSEAVLRMTPGLTPAPLRDSYCP
jgi:hypothetical protein